ncbi:MAG: membrane protein insertase YidC [Chitinophagales bacterium]|nr:membrane protein insertase YidC [Chitinophagales bacterium]
MDKNTITGFILLALLTVGYVFWSYKQQADIEKRKAQIVSTIQQDSTHADTVGKTDIAMDSSQTLPTAVENKIDSTIPFITGTSKEIVVENEDAVYIFDSKGGVIKSVELKNYKTHDQKPLILFQGNENEFGISFINNTNKAIDTKDLYFDTKATSSELSGEDVYHVDFVLNFGSDAQYVQSYIIHGKGYLVDFQVKSINASQFISPLSKTLDIQWNQDMPSLEDNIKEERMYSNVYYRNSKENVDELSARKNEDKTIEEQLQWVSFKQKFFNNTLISMKTPFNSGATLGANPNPVGEDIVKSANADLQLQLEKGKDFNFEMQWLFAPNKYTDLKKMKIGLDEIIPLGWAIFGWVNRFLIIPVFNILGKFISNYGVIIFILTLLLKLVLTPLNRKQLVSSAKMAILKPEIDALKKKYPNDKQMVGTKQMELFRNAGVNPMGGCFPILLQMPILFAMYRFFPNSIELRQEPFLWATDLSHYDSIMTLPFTIPIYGNHVSLFTLLMAITSIGYSRIMSQQQASMATDNAMAKQMQMMQYFTPIMFLFMFNSFSAALSYYYFLFNLLSLIQTYAIKKFFIDEKALKAEMDANMKNPKKKSAWQERVEQMMEQQKQGQQNKGRK